jgi:peptidoglycan/LPS O-acetylase OafA/YrhL
VAGLTTARYDAGRRIVFLDCVRGIAASIVVFGHFFELHSQHGIGPSGTSPGPYARWSLENLNLGRMGVAAFFLVSGYVIPLSLERQSQRTFWIRRFFRLYPVYWIALPAYLLMASISGWNLVSAPTLVLNLLMVQGAVVAVSLLPPGWTLGIELVF